MVTKMNVVTQQYQLASLGQRLLAQVLDGFIYSAIFMCGILLSATFESDILIYLAIGIAALYLLYQDGLGQGQSIGKRVTKTKVIDEGTGHPGTFGQSFVRNIPLIFLGIIDWIFIFGAKRQRLGDKLAGSLVVEDR